MAAGWALARPYFDPLACYTEWVLRQDFSRRWPPAGGIRSYGGVTAVVIDRQGPFQTEQITGDPGAQFPEEHAHPDVDSFEIVKFGRVYFSLNGAPLVPDAVIDELAGLGWPPEMVAPQRVRPTDFHGARVGPEGGVFLSCQMWLHGVAPTSVGLNWIGPPTSAEHEARWADEGNTGAAPGGAEPGAA